MKNTIKILSLLMAALLSLPACNGATTAPAPESESLPEQKKSVSVEEISFPRIVCKEGQWYLETGFEPEEDPGNLSWGHYAIECESYEVFCQKLKNLDFDKYEWATMKGMMTFGYGYLENGALMIPDPDLLENRHLSGGIDDDLLGKVSWGDEHSISIYRPRVGIVLTIWESEIIYSHYNYGYDFGEDLRDEYLETLETTIIDGKTVYRKKDYPEYMFYVDRTEKETVLVRWKDLENKMTNISVTVKEHGGLIYTYYGGLGLPYSWNGGYNNLSKYGEVRFSQTIAE